jgi:hypothetical protein
VIYEALLRILLLRLQFSGTAWEEPGFRDVTFIQILALVSEYLSIIDISTVVIHTLETD